jgi:hypothetical protein
VLASAAGERELRTARSVSEVLAWRIGRNLVADPGSETPASTPLAEEILPWLAGPVPSLTPDSDTGIARYLDEATDLISTRVDDLAAAAVRHRPPWMLPLGLPPDDPDAERKWLRHVAIVAAYREQYKVSTEDPRQLLGTYAETGQPGNKAYWHAAESVLAARRLAGLDPTAATATPEDQARVQLSADIYRALPADQRAQIATDVAARLGTAWFGDHTAPDEEAATQPAHAAVLTDTLVRRGLMTSTPRSAHMPVMGEEPLEADLARRNLAHRNRQADVHKSEAPAPAPHLEPPLRRDAATTPAPRHRLG